MATTKKTKAAVVKSTPNQDIFLKVITDLKPQVDEIGNLCLQIQVVDENTLAVAQQNLSKASSLVKSIEEKRKEAKQPILDAGKLIDSTCKSLIEVAEAGIAHIKEQVGNWEKKRLEEAKKLEEEAAAKASEEKAKIEAEEARKKAITDYINLQLIPYLQGTYEALKTPADCDNFLSYIQTKFPGAEKFKEYLSEAVKIRDNYINLISNKKQQFLTAGTLSEAEKHILAEKEAMAKLQQELAAKELALKAAEETARLEKEKRDAEAAAEAEALRIQTEASLDKTKNIRYNWRYEVYDMYQVPNDWKMVNDAAIKQYIKDAKGNLNDGQKLNGIRFFKEMIVTS